MRFILFYVVLCLAWASPALAQKCACTEADLQSRYATADAIFTGTVSDIHTIEKYVEYGNKDLPVEVTIEVDESFKKAQAGKPFVLKTSLTRDTCTGHPFEKGKRYLVFAYMRRAETFEYWSLYLFPSGTYDVGGLCGGTKLFDDAQSAQDIAQIRALQEAQPEKKRSLKDLIFNN